jgi:hypothetical protein
MPLQFQPGDVVVYRKTKNSIHPSLNARDVQPAPYGDSYNYAVDKYWRVVTVLPDNQIVVCTRKGKRHTLTTTDPALRRVRWWEKVFLRKRFPPRG